MLSRHLLALPLFAALQACAHVPQPYSFSSPRPRDEAIATITSELERSGIGLGRIDRQSGTITSRWFDTGYRFREIDDNRPLNYYTDIFLRHRISVVEAQGLLNVVVKTEVQRCAPLDAVITATEVDGSCQPMDFLFPTQQKQVEQLGKKLQVAVMNINRRF